MADSRALPTPLAPPELLLAAAVPRSRRWRWLRRLAANRLVLIGTILALLLVLIALFANLVAPYDPVALNVRHRQEAPSASYRFGTDRLGRDILSRVIFGARSSLRVAFASVSVAMLVGGVLGLASG